MSRLINRIVPFPNKWVKYILVFKITKWLLLYIIWYFRFCQLLIWFINFTKLTNFDGVLCSPRNFWTYRYEVSAINHINVKWDQYTARDTSVSFTLPLYQDLQRDILKPKMFRKNKVDDALNIPTLPQKDKCWSEPLIISISSNLDNSVKCKSEELLFYCLYSNF